MSSPTNRCVTQLVEGLLS